MTTDNNSQPGPVTDRLAQYFQQRGDFLAGLIATDLGSLKSLGLLSNKNLGNGDIGSAAACKAANNGHSNQQPPATVPDVESPVGSSAIGHVSIERNGNVNNQQTEPVELITAVNDPAGESANVEVVGNDLNEVVIENAIMELVEEQTGFPIDTLSSDMLLLDDLNLDSIKAAELIGSAAIKLQIAGEVDPSQLANSSIADVASTLLEKMDTGGSSAATNEIVDSGATKNDLIPSWVRSFGTGWSKSRLERSELDFKDSKILVVCDSSSNSIADAICDRIEAAHGHVTKTDYPSLYFQNGEFSHLIACLPVETSADDFAHAFKALSQRLHALTTSGVKTPSLLILEEQCDDSLDHVGACASGLVKSLHAERPDVNVRIVNWHPELDLQSASDSALAELQTRNEFSEVRLDAEGNRWKASIDLLEPIRSADRELSWGSDDVVLITGGAKGVTAECAIQLGLQTGARLALVGRSPWNRIEDSEVSRTMERCRKQNIDASYFQCDVASSEQVKNLVAEVQDKLGTITGVVHGAGINVPRRLEQVDLDSAIEENSPKVLGAHNLMSVLTDNPPKLFVSFTSIIGVTGMPGNGWYAFANELLARKTAAFAKTHGTQSVSLAYSVWQEVGMGAKLGSIDSLSRMGIDAIPVEDGVARFMQAFLTNPGADQIVVTARLGGLETWPRAHQKSPSVLRFMEDLIYFEPDVALVAEAHLTADTDQFVRDHEWKGSLLFPTVFGLEAMAQAVVRLTGKRHPEICSIEEISLKRPIIVEANNGTRIRIRAKADEVDRDGKLRIQIGVYCEQTQYAQPHFSAVFVVGQRGESEESGLRSPLEDRVALDPGTHLYGPLLFQGPMYQRLESVHGLTREYSQYSATNRSSEELGTLGFAESDETPVGLYVLGDPFFRDVLLHCCQLNIPQDLSLPIGIRKIDFFSSPEKESGKRFVQTILNDFDGSEYDCDVIVTDENGNTTERLRGYRLRVLENRPDEPTAVELANPEKRDLASLQERLESLCKKYSLKPINAGLIYQPQLSKQDLEQRRILIRRGVDFALRQCLEQQDVEIEADTEIDFEMGREESGQPTLRCAQQQGLAISLAHDVDYALAAIGTGSPQGCDLEPIVERDEETWLSMLGESRMELTKSLVVENGDLNLEATRVWTAHEALFKATQNSDLDLHKVARKVSRKGSSMLLAAEHDNQQIHVLTFSAELTRNPARMLAIVVESQTQSPEEAEDNFQAKLAQLNDRFEELPESVLPFVDIGEILAEDSHHTGLAFDSPDGQPVFEHRFQVGFRESCTLGRTVSLPRLINWVAKMREMPLRSMGPRMVEEFSHGQYGLVTNSVSSRVFGEATSYDTIHSRCWMGNSHNSTFTGFFEFCKVESDESLTRIAVSEVTSTYVEMQEYGVPKPVPFPDYLSAYLNCYSSNNPVEVDLRDQELEGLMQRPQPLEDFSLGSKIAELDLAKIGDENYLLSEDTFQTTLEESNLVGNVYFSNYFIWQNRVLDLFLFKAAPQLMRVMNSQGEILSLFSRMNFLREAMPFDKIQVKLFAKCVYEHGADLVFEFFIREGNQLQKIQTGEQRVAWVQRKHDIPMPATWPTPIKQQLLNSIEGKSHK